ncbi:MAG: DUF4956 domain-containing protein [Ilumatobacteraceae bacterium]
MNELDVPELLRNLALDLVALFVLVHVGYFLRHRQWDQVVGYVAFNISLFTVSSALGASAPLNIGVGFGLFAVLSIVRLRSGEAGQIEIGYTMVSLVLGLMSGLSGMSFEVKVVFAVVLVAAMLTIDFRGDRRVHRWARLRLELDEIIVDDAELNLHIERRLGAPPMSVQVRGIDFVRDTMRLDVVLDRRRSRS